MAFKLRVEGVTLTYIKGIKHHLVIPNHVKIIARHTFRDYQGEIIVVPKGIEVIGPNTFTNCNSTVYIDSVNKPGIHKEAFSGFLGQIKPLDAYQKPSLIKQLFKSK